MGDRYNIHSQLEHLQSKYVGTGHADTTRWEWLTNQHRDTYSSYIGHHDLTNVIAIAENETRARMTTTFVDSFGEIVSLKANIVKSKNASASVGVQSKPPGVRESDCQTNVGCDVALQTDDVLANRVVGNASDQDANYNWHTLNDFLLRSEPMILRTISENRRTTRLFAVYDAATAMDEREAHVAIDLSLKSEADWPEGAQALSVAWNSSGTTVGVACGRMAHDDWCTHRGFVMTWNIDRGRLNPNKADHIYEMVSCCTSLAFHPSLPNFFASCTYTGDVLVWSLSEESDPVASAQLADQGPIYCVAWLSSSATSDLTFASAGADGRILIWTVPSRGRTLTLNKAFQLTVANLPRSIRGKVGGENKSTGVGAVSFARPPLTSRFMAGTETGGVFQCTTETSGMNAVGGRVTVAGADGATTCYDPLALIQKPHNGPVYKVAFHPRAPAIAASCGGDGFVRVGAAFQTLPALEIDTNLGSLYDLSWSPLRPCVLACATSTGRLLVFDLVQATDRPILNIDTTTHDRVCPLIAVVFNPRRAHILATGDGSGYVKVWNLGEAFASAQAREEQVLDELVANALGLEEAGKK